MQAPFRDRSISLTLESELNATSKKPFVTNGAFVSKYLPSSGLLSNVTNRPLNKGVAGPKTLTLSGVTNIQGEMAADVGEDLGVATSFLQAWYIKPIPITLSGTSYLGTYPGLSVGDRDFENLIKKFKYVANDFTTLYGSPGKKERVLLEINGYPDGAIRFIGFISRLNWSEEIRNANVINWTLGFIGRSADNLVLYQGHQNSDNTKQISGS